MHPPGRVGRRHPPSLPCPAITAAANDAVHRGRRRGAAGLVSTPASWALQCPQRTTDEFSPRAPSELTMTRALLDRPEVASTSMAVREVQLGPADLEPFRRE